jgi:hypothetical protein
MIFVGSIKAVGMFDFGYSFFIRRRMFDVHLLKQLCAVPVKPQNLVGESKEWG